MTYRPSFTLSARIGPSFRISTFCLSGSCPVRAADATKWADYIQRLASALKAADYPDREDYEKAQAIFKEAETVYRTLAHIYSNDRNTAGISKILIRTPRY